jgi:hypothetical protein
MRSKRRFISLIEPGVPGVVPINTGAGIFHPFHGPTSLSCRVRTLRFFHFFDLTARKSTINPRNLSNYLRIQLVT